tara:strand:+ start:227 stop:454 length:228 start_codon:yes stop_codon:yes gene_type:complete
MCIFGTSRPAAPPKPEFRNAPPVVTGSQTGVEKPKDTEKVTEELKIRRRKKESKMRREQSSSNPGNSLNIPTFDY